MFFFHAIQIAFAFAFGACVGSLINVLVYRMPRGLSVVTPPSRCPKCNHLLSWRENIPVFGWICLRGKCRFCKNPISPEYPIVEAIVGLLFVLFYVLWYLVPSHGAIWAGIDWSNIRPEWARNGFAQTWPIFIALMILVGSLVAMTIIDARTFMIPLALAWTPTVVAFIAHPLWAFVLELRGTHWYSHAPGYIWAIPTPGPFDWPLLLAAFGVMVGLGVANILLSLGLIRRSFADYDQWEEQAMKEAGIAPPGEDDQPEPSHDQPGLRDHDAQGPATDEPNPTSRSSTHRGKVILTAAGFIITGMVLGSLIAKRSQIAPIFGILCGLLVAVPAAGPICRLFMQESAPDTPSDTNEPDSPATFWIQYPHARREILREVLFLLPALILGIIGYQIGHAIGSPWRVDPDSLELIASRTIPLWLSVLGGVCMGYIVGGGLIWGIRIFGTLGFGKEAMGLGDVHLLAAVGATLGWIDSLAAFFLAPFLAIYIVIVQTTWTGNGKRAMPYGPYLAIATIVVLLTKPGLEALITHLFGQGTPIHIP